MPSIGTDRRQSRKRTEAPDLRRKQLIEATIETLLVQGYGETTLENVTRHAGLSRGLVNFHFGDKETLLSETLKQIAEDHQANWILICQSKHTSPTDLLISLIKSDLDFYHNGERIMAGWHILWGNARLRANYQELWGPRDSAFREALTRQCEAARYETGDVFDSAKVASAICTLLDGLHLRMMLKGDLTAADALSIVSEYLAKVLPGHFPRFAQSH